MKFTLELDEEGLGPDGWLIRCLDPDCPAKEFDGNWWCVNGIDLALYLIARHWEGHHSSAAVDRGLFPDPAIRRYNAVSDDDYS